VTLQTSATTAAQFTLGRVINFATTGFTIIVIPIYLGETSPRELRGMMNATIQLMIIFGQLVASLVNLGTKNMASNAGWRIPVGLQLIPPAVLTVLWPLLPESPRWSVDCRYSREEDDNS
jgi:MFS transporter, SP family, sugar:H+ symporter